MEFQPIPKASSAQVDYMRVLFNDLGFTTRKLQIGFLILRNVDVNALDDVTVRQAQAVITELKEMRIRHQEQARQLKGDEDDVDN